MVTEPSIIIIGLVLLLSFVVPVIWIARRGSRRSDLIKKEYDKIKRDHHLNISEKDHWQNRLIGMDSSARKLVFLYDKAKDIETFLINISDTKDIKIKKSDSGDIVLSLLMKDGQQKELSFYKASKDYVSGQYPAGILAEKWRDRLMTGKVKTV